MTPLSPFDQMFLWIEKQQQPMHVAGLQLFSFPEDAGPHYVSELAEHMRSFTQAQAPFNRRLVTRLGKGYWEEDDEFDLDHHFRHFALPEPGRIRDLLALVSAEHGNLLDRQRPLWEVYLIEGIEGRRFALYSKIHHSMADGVATARMFARALSNSPDTRDMPPVWANPPRKKAAVASHPADKASGLARLMAGVGKQAATLPSVVSEIVKISGKAMRDPDVVSVFQAPQCLLNQSITGSRRFAAQSYSMDRFKAVGKIFECTINDVVLAVCASALREYLLSQQDLPEKPLIAMVPVSLRKDDSDAGNQVAVILANLATHVADPAKRLQLIKASVQESKARLSQMTPEEILNYTTLTLAPSGLTLLTGLAPQLQAFNVVISNVPGPREPLYWNGARLQGMYPVSIPIDRVALNITLTSYCNQLDFGLVACRRTLPSVQKMLEYLEKGLRELEWAAWLVSSPL